MQNLLEVCAGSYQDCITAWKNGAARVELNSSLSTGGLTPGLATLQKVKEDTRLSVICMARPRSAGFCYDSCDEEIMLRDAEIFLKNGADGIAFGYLHADKTIDMEQTARMVQLIHSYGKTAVFHRAFDITPDPDDAIKALITCRTDRILTSGQKETALDGLHLLKHLQAVYGSHIEILPGSGINSTNAVQILQDTGVYQLHSSCKSYREDSTTIGNHVSFSYLPAPCDESYMVVDGQAVKELVEVMSAPITFL